MTTPRFRFGNQQGRRQSPEELRALVRRAQQVKAARRAEEISKQIPNIEPSSPLGKEGLQSLRESQTPLTPKEEKSFFDKTMDAISFTGDVSGAGTLSLLSRVPLTRRLIEESTLGQTSRGGRGSDTPFYKRLTDRRRELQNEGMSFVQASRKAYQEARDDKEFRVGVPTITEIITDPLNFIGVGVATKVVKGVYKGTKPALEIVPGAKRLLSQGEILEKTLETKIKKFKGDNIQKLANLVETAPFIGKSLAKVFTTRGTAYRDSQDVIGASLAEHNIKNALRESQITEAMANLTPAESKIKFGNIGSRKTFGERLFDVDNAGRVEIEVVNKNIKVGNTVVNPTKLKADIDKLPKDTDIPFQVADRESLTNVLEKMFPVVLKGESLDQFAQRYIKGKKISDAAFRTKYKTTRENFGWMNLQADDLREFAAFRKINGKDLTPDQLLYTRNLYELVDDVARQMENAGVQFERVGVGFKVKDDANALTQLRRSYFPRTLLFEGMRVAKDKAAKQNSSSRFGGTFRSTKERKLLDDSVFESEIDDLVNADVIKVGNSIDGSIEAYLRGAFKAIDDADLVKNVKAELKKKNGFSIRTANRKAIYKEIDEIFAKTTDPTAKDLKELEDLIDKNGLTRLKKFINEKDGLRKIKSNLDNFEDSRIVSGVIVDAQTKKGKEFIKRMEGLLDSDTIKNGYLAKAAGIGDIIRIGKTGLDIGFSLIQGLPLLGVASANIFTNPKRAADLYATWGKSTVQGFKSLFQKNSMEAFMREAASEIIEIDGRQISLLRLFVENGGQLGRRATDIFQATDNSLFRGDFTGSQLKNVGRVALNQTFGRAEDAFTHASDVLRIEGFRNLWRTYAKEPDGLVELTNFLNKSTGALNPLEHGILPRQQQIERMFLFFSPRYTRSSLSLLTDLARGGVQGKLARQSIAGMAGFGLGVYLVACELLGQQAQLDPTKSGFMQVKINDDMVGFGTFWTGFARMVVGVVDDVNPYTIDTVLDQQRAGPIENFVSSRFFSAPLTSAIRDVIRGETFVGQQLEGTLDYAKHLAKSPLPFWLEGALFADPYRSGVSGTVGELLGFRTTPVNIYKRRNLRRDSVAEDKFGKLYANLNTLQKREVDEDEIVKDLKEQIDETPPGRTTELNTQQEIYYNESEKISDIYMNELMEVASYLGISGYTHANLRENWNEIKAEQRTRREDLRLRTEPGGDLSLMESYFKDLKANQDDKRQPEDQIVDLYVSEVLDAPHLDSPTGYNWRERDKLIAEFIQKYGTEMFNYAVAATRSGRKLLPVEQEYYTMREKYAFYWEASEQAVIEQQDDPQRAQELLDEYYRVDTDPHRERMENDELIGPTIKKLLRNISGVKKELRKMNPGLDGYLFRWGFTSTLLHPSNQSRDALNLWRSNDTLEEVQYDNSERQLTPRDN